MTIGANRALLFLDVDGTVLPYSAADSAAGQPDWTEWQQPTNPALSRVSRVVGERLLALGCELLWAAGRPFIWIDDEIRDHDEIWVCGNHPGRALLHRVDGMSGLLDTDFTALAEWLAAP